MLYLHCGWARTSTTSLQTALYEHRESLADANVFFPERWLTRVTPTHHGLSELLRDSRESADPVEEFKSFLTLHSEQEILFSAEALTTWLFPLQKLETLLDFLAAVTPLVPTRCIWTLRRLDDGLRSLYLRRLASGFELLPPDQHFAKMWDLSDLFAGMRRVEEAVGGDVIYIKYDSRGAHNEELLEAFRIPARVKAEISEQIQRGPRLNGSISHKQTVTLLNLDVLSARLGIQLDGGALRNAFTRGELSFEDDWPCELVGGEMRQSLHERALADARVQGFLPYVEFFGDAEIDVGPVDLTPDVITDEDLQRLVAHGPRLAESRG